MANKRVTAVDWLSQKLDIAPDNPLLAQAKAMEKEQIMDAYSVCDDCGTSEEAEFYAEKYYEETYGTQLPKE